MGAEHRTYNYKVHSAFNKCAGFLSTSSMQGAVRGLQQRGGKVSSFLQCAAEEAVGWAGFQTQTWVGALHPSFTLGGT